MQGLVEKPAPKDAPSNLSIIGRYVLMPEVIGHLARMERGAGNEVQLTDGMAKLIGKQPFHGLRYEGRRFDCGDKIGFLEAQIAFALKRPDLADAVRGLPESSYVDAPDFIVEPPFCTRDDRRWHSPTASTRPCCANTTSAASSATPCTAPTPSPSAAASASIVARAGGTHGRGRL